MGNRQSEGILMVLQCHPDVQLWEFSRGLVFVQGKHFDFSYS